MVFANLFYIEIKFGITDYYSYLCIVIKKTTIMTTKDIFWATKIGLEYLKSYEPNLGTTEEVAIGCIDTLQEILSKQIDRLDNNKLIDAKIISK